MFDILLRFHKFKVALTADFEKAFLQISVAEHDCDYLRFLWVEDATKEISQIKIYQFARGVFGLSPSPFLQIKHHLEGYLCSHPKIFRLLESIYVDEEI